MYDLVGMTARGQRSAGHQTMWTTSGQHALPWRRCRVLAASCPHNSLKHLHLGRLQLPRHVCMHPVGHHSPKANGKPRAQWIWQQLLQLAVCCAFPLPFAVVWVLLDALAVMAGLRRRLLQHAVLRELWIGIAADLAYHAAWMTGRRLARTLQVDTHLSNCTLVTSALVYVVARAYVDEDLALSLGLASVPRCVVHWFGRGRCCKASCIECGAACAAKCYGPHSRYFTYRAQPLYPRGLG